MPYTEELKKVSNMIQKLETLEPTHELRSLANSLQQKVDAVNAALDARQQAANIVRRA